MLNSERVLKVATAVVYVAALVVAYMDLFIWRP